MQPECLPIDAVPGLTPLYRAAVGGASSLTGPAEALVRECYPAVGKAWLENAGVPKMPAEQRARLADLLAEQNHGWGANAAAMENIERLRAGADAVVSGQQVALFGGPLLTLLKAATAVRLAQQATAAGRPHIPIFWMASEDHDFAEVDHVALLGRHEVETVSIAENDGDAGRPVGARLLGESVTAALEQAKFLLGHADVCEWLEAAYTPGTTMADAFAKFTAPHFCRAGAGAD